MNQQEKMKIAFDALVENKDCGLSLRHLFKIMVSNGLAVLNRGTPDYISMLESNGYLVWRNDDGKLFPYKNMHTGQKYE